jgi:hypothetical protein
LENPGSNHWKHVINNKNKVTMKIKILTIVAAVVCATAFQAAAQGGGGGMGGMGGAAGGRGGRGGVLSQEDRTALQTAVQDDAAYTKLRTDLQAAQTAAVEAALAADAKDATVKAKLEAVAKLQTDMALAYYKLVLKTVKLTDDQKTQLKTGATGYTTIFGGVGGGAAMGRGGMGGAGGGMGGMGGMGGAGGAGAGGRGGRGGRGGGGAGGGAN